MSQRSLASDETSGPGATRAANRIAGLVVTAFALVLWFLVIPDQVDKADYGWMRPRTLPMICAVSLGLLGLILAVFPHGAVDLSPRKSARVAVLALISAIAVWSMGRFGFVIVAPILAAVLLVYLNERRWPCWLGAVVGVPVVIWVVVTQLLGRGLP